MKYQYEDVCSELNCRAKVYSQETGKLKCAFGNSDVIVLMTNLCSHAMARIARDEAKRRSIALLQIHGNGCSQFRQELLLHLGKVSGI
jgi:hypothetical protein